MSQHYDVIAIGAGSGGLSVVEKAVKYGKKCAVVEVNDEVGGTCESGLCTQKSHVVCRRTRSYSTASH